MEIHLTRLYFPEGTNGKLTCEGKHICNTIELPWKENAKRVSCIPERKYKLKIRYSHKFKWHLEVVDVENRNYILIHPANNALRELNGCIAPVTKISGPGVGLMSREALEKLKELIYPKLEQGVEVTLIIES